MRRPRKRWLVLILALWLIAAGWLAVDLLHRPRLVIGPMVQLARPDGFTLVWSLHARRDALLEVLGPDGAPAGTTDLASEGNRTIATVTGLAPDTSYRYRLRSVAWGRETTLHQDTIRTAPPVGHPFRFIAIGDTGDGELDQHRVAALLGQHEPDLIVHTGDVVYDVGAPEDYFAHFYRPYANLLARIPFYPCLGNHDVYTDNGRPLLDAFVLPRNGPPAEDPERAYWFDYGHARFVTFDSNREYVVLNTIVAPWMEEVLSQAGDRWKIVFFHHPPYTNGRYEPNDTMLRTIVPVLDRQRAHVVFNGHNHMYERTHPIRNGIPQRSLHRPRPGGALLSREPRAGRASTAPATHSEYPREVEPAADTSASSAASQPADPGTVYIVTGAGGAGLYREQDTRPPYMAAWYHDRHSFTVVDVAPDQIRLRQINDRGETVDEALLLK